MPSRLCSVCGERIVWKANTWKFELKNAPYFCSAECALEWSFCNATGCYPNSLPCSSSVQSSACKVTSIYSPVFNTYFRSKYELLVAESFLLWGFRFEYETWLFNLDAGLYLPDFLVVTPNGNLIVEVKGLWEPGAKKKVLCFEETCYDELPIVVFSWNLFHSFERMVNANKTKTYKRHIS